MLKLQFVLVCISVSTVTQGPALATEHVGASFMDLVAVCGRCVGSSLWVRESHDPGGKSLRWELPEACVLQISGSSPEAARRDGVPYCPFRCFSASFPPSFLHKWKQQTPPWIFAGYSDGGLFVLLLTSVFFSWSLYWQSFSTFLLSCRMLRFLCLLLWFLQRGFLTAYQAGC